MKPTDPTPDVNDREKRIHDLLMAIGGLEAAILRSLEEKDYEFSKILKEKRADYYERLRRVSYGLPETRRERPEA